MPGDESPRPPVNKRILRDGRACIKRVWLSQHRPDLAAAPDEAARARMAAGSRVGELARTRWPEGVLVPGSARDLSRQVTETQRLMAEGASVLFEAAFTSDGRFARADILERTDDGWRVIEVKSSTQVKDDHLDDLAFQWLVMSGAGLEITQLCLMHVNKEMEFHEPISHLLVEVDVTERVRSRLLKLEQKVEGLEEVLLLPAAPDVQTNVYCRSPEECPFIDFCHEGVALDDVQYLPGARAKWVEEWRAAGLKRIPDLDQEVKSGAAINAVRAAKNGGRWVDEALPYTFENWRWPWIFYDLESVQSVEPLYPGCRPYDQIPFQWSAHVWESPESEPVHFGYLAEAGHDPRPRFVAELLPLLQDAGTVIHYSNYELTAAGAMAKAGIAGADHLVEILARRAQDLLPVVKDNIYDLDFQASYSIKAVLPVLCPGFDYKDLAINNGGLASEAFLRLHAPDCTPDEAAEIRENLWRYCERDTLAMVKVVQALLALGVRP